MASIRFVMALALALLMVGCGRGYMMEAQTPQSVGANASAATVIFVRPSGYGGGEFPILDGQGHFLGAAPGNSWFVVSVPAGEHLFIAWSEGTPALKATLEAGKIYYVEVGVTIGAWSPRARLFAVGPQRPQWAELPKWLSETTPVVPAPDAGQRFQAKQGGEVGEVVQKGVQNYAEYDAEAKGQRTLQVTDGVTAPVAAGG